MYIEHTSKYLKIIEVARSCDATRVSFQHHTFVCFNNQHNAKRFRREIMRHGLKPWEINPNRPGVPFEVIVERW